MEKVCLERLSGLEDKDYVQTKVDNYNMRKLEDKINEIIEWINDHKDQLLN